MTPSRIRPVGLALLFISVGCTSDTGVGPPDEGTGLVFEVSPAQIQPGQTFTVTFPPDTGVAADLVLRRGDEPLYVFHGHSGPDGPMGAEKVENGEYSTHPAGRFAEPGVALSVEAELPADVEPGPMRICSEDDCAEFEIIEP